MAKEVKLVGTSETSQAVKSNKIMRTKYITIVLAGAVFVVAITEPTAQPHLPEDTFTAPPVYSVHIPFSGSVVSGVNPFQPWGT